MNSLRSFILWFAALIVFAWAVIQVSMRHGLRGKGKAAILHMNDAEVRRRIATADHPGSFK